MSAGSSGQRMQAGTACLDAQSVMANDPETIHRKVRELFDALADLPTDERAVELAKARRSEPEVAEQTERLLLALERSPEPQPVITFDEVDEAPGRLLADGDVVRTPMGPLEIVGFLSDQSRASSAEVYEARHADAGRVALKLLRHTGTGHEIRRRFVAEAEALRSLDHPHIARLLSAGVIERDDGPASMGIITRFVPGPTLDEWAAPKQEGSADPGESTKSTDEIVRVVSQIARAVEHIHLRQILHRDIKPSNIVVESGHGADGYGVLLDLGVAKFVGEQWDQYASLGHTVAGTLRYMAPEQLTPSSAKVDYRADIYALGAVLYELLAGRPLVDVTGRSEVEAFRLKMDTRPQLPKEARGIGSLSVRSLALQSALVAAAARPEDRYNSAGRFADDLDRAIAGRPLSIRPMGRARRTVLFMRRHPAATVAVALFIAALLALGAIYFAGQQRVAEARLRAEARFEDSRAFARWAIFELTDQLGAIANTTTVRHELIEKAVETLERLSEDPVAEPGLLLELAEGYERLGELINTEMGDIARSMECFQAASRLLSLSPDQDSPQVRLLRTRLNFLEAMAIDADHYSATHSSQIEAMIGLMDSIEQELPGDARLYHWRSRMHLQRSRHYVLEDCSADMIVEATERLVEDADRALSLDPNNLFMHANEVLARFWRAHAFYEIEDPSVLEVVDEAIDSARRLVNTGHALADFYLSRALCLRCRALVSQGDLKNFAAEAVIAIEVADKGAAREPDNKWPNRQAEVARMQLARALLQSPKEPGAEMLAVAQKWAHEGWALWQERTAKGWTSALENARYPDNYQSLLRQVDEALERSFLISQDSH